jgi:hypothetical protein
MNTSLKKTNTLFHTLTQFDYLKQIVQDKGFKASYADEIISELNVKILMVSFSNVALFESETQINYGRYSIGLSLSWGKQKGLQPVLYTYSDSTMGRTFFENYFISEKDQTILTILDEKERESQNIGLILDLRQIAENSKKMLLYLKEDIVKNKKGDEFKAYNDREWRFVYEDIDHSSIIFERNFLNAGWIEEYQHAKSYPKPYTSNPVLLFELDDVKYVILETREEKKIILMTLFLSFGKEKVMERILNGNLDILTRRSLWDDI